MSRADFNYIPVQNQFTALRPRFGTSFPIHVGNGREISDDAYLLITVQHVDADTHRISINNKTLDDRDPIDIPKPPGSSAALLTYMKHIQPGVLQAGPNDLNIFRVADDDFFVKEVVIHWREV